MLGRVVLIAAPARVGATGSSLSFLIRWWCGSQETRGESTALVLEELSMRFMWARLASVHLLLFRQSQNRACHGLLRFT